MRRQPESEGASPVSYTHLDVYKRQVMDFHEEAVYAGCGSGSCQVRNEFALAAGGSAHAARELYLSLIHIYTVYLLISGGSPLRCMEMKRLFFSRFIHRQTEKTAPADEMCIRDRDLHGIPADAGTWCRHFSSPAAAWCGGKSGARSCFS